MRISGRGARDEPSEPQAEAGGELFDPQSAIRIPHTEPMLTILGAAFAAGLLGSPHCLGMCGGFATACGRPGGGLLLWHAGRLSTYMALGALAGGFGAVLPGPAWVPAVLSLTLLTWFALSLAGVVPEPAPHARWIGRAGAAVLGRRGVGWRYAFGLVNGLLPCGMVYAALSIAIAMAHPLGGALAMLAFGLGTAPALTLFPGLVRRLAARSLWHRRAVAALVVAAGLSSIGLRALAPDGHAHGDGRAPGGVPAEPRPAGEHVHHGH
jgi:uncharacterized protein